MRFKTIFSPGRWVRALVNSDGQITQVKLVKLARQKPICLVPLDAVWHQFRVRQGHRECARLTMSTRTSELTATGFSPCRLAKNEDTFQNFDHGNDWGPKRSHKVWWADSRALPSRLSRFLTRRTRVITYQDMPASGKEIKSKLK